MTRHAVSRGLRPGQPETSGLETLAFLVVLFAAGLFGWVVFGVLVYLVIVYTLFTLTFLIVGAVTTAALWLAIKGNGRARALAAGLMVGAVVFVAWVWTL